MVQVKAMLKYESNSRMQERASSKPPSTPPLTPSLVPTSREDENDGDFAAPDLIVDQEDFDDVVNTWFVELELEAMMADRVNETTALVCCPHGTKGPSKNSTLLSLFGPTLAMLDEATIDTI